MIVVVMGVSGSGKSTVGKRLAAELGWTYIEGDDFHPAANKAKMHRGEPLDDDDRRGWLEAIRARLAEAVAADENVVLACSALKHAYQHYLSQVDPADVRYVFLEGSEELIRQRLEQRRGHFMNPDLLDSQFDALEPPADAIRVDIAPPPEEIVSQVRQKLGW